MLRRTVIVAVLAAVVVLVAILIVRAVTVHSRQIAVAPVPPVAVNSFAALARFSRAIQFRTVSSTDPAQLTEHDLFLAWLVHAYPRVHGTMTREVVAGRSLLYTWRGTDASLRPILLMGHYDVVPVEPASLARWTQPPFSGAIRDGYVWGRGTMDDKISVVGLLEAAEMLIASGWQPKRTILFAFGHDEEIGGYAGAAQIARLLASRGVKLHSILDEGGSLTVGVVPAMKKPVALVGIGEKGFVSLELSTSGAGGHSSMPPPLTAVGLIAHAVDRVQSRPFPAEVRSGTRAMFEWLAPQMPIAARVAVANLWLTSPLLKLQAARSPSLNAALRTTIAPTMIGGGVKDNVVPTEAHAIINFRIFPGDTISSVIKHVRDAVDDSRVVVRQWGELAQEPSPVSNPDSRQFATIHRTIRQIDPAAVVAPFLVVGATDSRHYTALSANVFRFIPMHVAARDLERVHGIDERIAVDDFVDAIRFYRQLMINSAS